MSRFIQRSLTCHQVVKPWSKIGTQYLADKITDKTNPWDLWNFPPKDHIIYGSKGAWDACPPPPGQFFYFLFHPVLGDNG